MRLLDLTVLSRLAALIASAALLTGCPKKDNEAAPEPAAPAAPAARAPASDKAGVEPAAAPEKKKDDDKGGW